ncbi:hypothetical protein O7A70_27730 [Mesorhizobium sp. Cs1299R1N1]|uniref:hypothetical protein n=1 Tax=Mesorhizobium sp. Cs1299R1N1 TaxID=3015172 RepID=UPI00301DB398
MKIIPLICTALVVSAGATFAGSDHYEPSGDQQSATVTDYMHVFSTKKTGNGARMPQTVLKPAAPTREPGQGIWGH